MTASQHCVSGVWWTRQSSERCRLYDCINTELVRVHPFQLLITIGSDSRHDPTPRDGQVDPCNETRQFARKERYRMRNVRVIPQPSQR